MTEFSAVILAGGKSSRMGCDKAWLDCDGQPLIRRQLEMVQQLQPQEIFISARPGGDLDSLGWPVVPDNFPDHGPLAGIESALGIVQSTLLLVLAVDMPHLRAQTLRQLFRRCGNGLGVVPSFENQPEPLAAFYPKAAQSIAIDLLRVGKNSAKDFAQRCVELDLVVVHELPGSLHGDFANWNSPADIN